MYCNYCCIRSYSQFTANKDSFAFLSAFQWIKRISFCWFIGIYFAFSLGLAVLRLSPILVYFFLIYLLNLTIFTSNFYFPYYFSCFLDTNLILVCWQSASPPKTFRIFSFPFLCITVMQVWEFPPLFCLVCLSLFNPQPLVSSFSKLNHHCLFKHFILPIFLLS